jgi:hypothetical protein
MFDSDLAAMFADPVITVPANIGASSTRGIFAWEDVFENDPNGGFATTSRQVLTIVAGSLAGAVRGAAITIDGNAYTVRDLRHASPKQSKVIVT